LKVTVVCRYKKKLMVVIPIKGITTMSFTIIHDACTIITGRLPD